jgi:TatD DNase family protein
MVIDSHCHLAGEEFADDLPDVVARAAEAGVTRALCILSADEAPEVARAVEVRAAWPAVEFAAAVHPHRAGAYADATRAAELTRVACERSGAIAIGEIGLDYHYDFAPRPAQHEVFGAQIALALELGLPVVVHTREATDDTVALLREAGAGRVRGVMHCFTGSPSEARQALDLGFHISLAGMVTFPRAAELRALAAFVPTDRLLVETDAPFLAPVPHRGKRNEPAWVVETARTVAAARATDLETLGAAVSRNFHALFLGGQ